MTVYLSRIAFGAMRMATCQSFAMNSISKTFAPKSKFISSKNNIFLASSTVAVRYYSSSDGIQPTVALDNAGMPLKKKIIHKKSSPADLSQKEGHFLTFAFATANAYDLKSLKEALVQQKLYETGK